MSEICEDCPILTSLDIMDAWIVANPGFYKEEVQGGNNRPNVQGLSKIRRELLTSAAANYECEGKTVDRDNQYTCRLGNIVGAATDGLVGPSEQVQVKQSYSSLVESTEPTEEATHGHYL